MDTSRQLWGDFVVSISFKNLVESFRYEGIFLHVVVTIDQQVGIWVQ